MGKALQILNNLSHSIRLKSHVIDLTEKEAEEGKKHVDISKH
jgi:hypothetical protein